MKKYINTIYQKISQCLYNKGYNPIFLEDNEKNTQMLLFVDYSEKIILSTALEKIDNTLYLFEGSLFDESNINGGISCGFYCACSISYGDYINIDELISQFENNFNQFILAGKDFIKKDKMVADPEMQSGIVFENPQIAITKYAKKHNLEIVISTSSPVDTKLE